MQNILDCLSKAPVFSKFTERDRQELMKHAMEKKYSRDEYVCWQGEVWPYVAYIATGKLEWAMLSPEGRRQVVFNLNPCDVIWGHSVVDNLPMPLCFKPAKIILYLWDVKPPPNPVAERRNSLGRFPCPIEYMRHVREVVYGFAFHPVAGRLARLLLSHYATAGWKICTTRPDPRPIPDTVGTTRELVSRTLHRFADEGFYSNQPHGTWF